MDKETLKDLGAARLAAIIYKLYQDNLLAYADSKKQEQKYKKLNQITEAEEEHSRGYVSGYVIRQIQTAVQFESAKLKKLQPLHRSMLAFLKEHNGIKNKKEFLYGWFPVFCICKIFVIVFLLIFHITIFQIKFIHLDTTNLISTEKF